ncbi:MAG: DUF397 domain-containing protein [Pseudonocardiaceae bacterium]
MQELMQSIIVGRIGSGVMTALVACWPPGAYGRWKMPPVTSGVPAPLPRGVRWTKSSHSNPNGNCVELAQLPEGIIAVRNSRRPAGPALLWARAEMAVFVRAVRDGEFDGRAG